MPIDPLRIYVLWSPKSTEGSRLAESITRWFDGLGMDADGTSIRVPVRFRSASWTVEGGPPRPLDLSQTHHNIVIFLHDLHTNRERDVWSAYITGIRAAMESRGACDAYLPVGDPSGLAGPLSGEETLQYVRRDRWPQSARRSEETRLLLHVVFHARKILHLDGRIERLFVSHAKRDSHEIAAQIVDAVRNSQNDVPIETFFDATELLAGERFDRRFEQEIANGTLLAIGSDDYDGRPWCNQEMMIAKQAGRPIVIADMSAKATPRTFPYGANVPRHRIGERDVDGLWIERLLVEVLSEGLRCDVFGLAAKTRAPDGAAILPRPPELLDVVCLPPETAFAIYPDPPLSRSC